MAYKKRLPKCKDITEIEFQFLTNNQKKNSMTSFFKKMEKPRKMITLLGGSEAAKFSHRLSGSLLVSEQMSTTHNIGIAKTLFETGTGEIDEMEKKINEYPFGALRNSFTETLNIIKGHRKVTELHLLLNELGV